MLSGGRNIANKYHWRVWGALTVYGPNWICPSSWQCVLPGSILLRLQVALQGNCPKWGLHFVPFPGLSSSGHLVLGKCTVPSELCILITSLAPSDWFTRFSRPQERHLRCALCLLWDLIPGCHPPDRCQLSSIPGKLG